VQTLDDKNLGGLDELRWVEEASDMVVDLLLDCISFFDRLHLLIHEIKVVGPWVEGSDNLRQLYPCAHFCPRNGSHQGI
jgi:hypothetical protein